MLYLTVKRETIHLVNCEIFGVAECEMKFATFASANISQRSYFTCRQANFVMGALFFYFNTALLDAPITDAPCFLYVDLG